jgi:Integral membrane protein TerC family
MEWLSSPEAWIALVTLTLLEVVLGIDNVIFISIVAGKLPTADRARARRLGLTLAMLMRIALLASIAWIARLTTPLVTLFGFEISGRDLILITGGLFLIGKATYEIHDKLEGEEGHASVRVPPSFGAVIVQILLLDIVFSLDSVITAIGMADDLAVMVLAVIIAVGVMLVFSGKDWRVRRAPPDAESAGPELLAADRHVARGRRLPPAHLERLHLLRDGLLGVRRDREPEDPRARGAGGAETPISGGRAQVGARSWELGAGSWELGARS